MPRLLLQKKYERKAGKRARKASHQSARPAHGPSIDYKNEQWLFKFNGLAVLLMLWKEIHCGEGVSLNEPVGIIT